MQDTPKLRVSQSVLEAGPVKLRGEASETEAVFGVGGVGCVEGADGDGGELRRRDLAGKCVDDGDRGAGGERGVWDFASGAEGFNVLLGDF